MSVNDISDPLKPLTQLNESDSRYRFMLGASVENFHAVLSDMTLHPDVPVDVRQLFETAKNLSLYSWYVYRFHQVAETVGFSALEMALRTRFERDNPGVKKRPRGLSELLIHAKKEKWIENERFPDRWRDAYRNAEHKKMLQMVQSGILKSGESMPVENPTEEEVQQALEVLDEVTAMVVYAPKLRNSLAHGSSTMHPGSLSSLRKVAEVINQVYTTD